MFGRPITLFKMFGFAVRIDLSWVVLAVLVTWSLAAYYFPVQYPGMGVTAYWVMGAAGAAGLFISIVFHELCHSLVARRYGLPMKGITLFIFGGVAEMSDEPPSAKAEFLMAIAGPIASVALAVLFVGLALILRAAQAAMPAAAVLYQLGVLNLVLAVFNLIPGFPLDGGRVLRSILWHYKGDMRWATRVASRVGSGFGMVLILLGIFNVLNGYFVGGLWWLLIGLFLRNAANRSYQQLIMRQSLEGEPVSRFMTEHPVTVAPQTPVEQLVESYIYKYHHDMFPVVDGEERLTGCVTVKDIKQVPRSEWPTRTAGQLAVPCSESNTIGPQEDAVAALSTMTRNNNSRLLVVSGSRLVGIITLKDLLKLLSLKLQLEGGGDGNVQLPGIEPQG